MSRRWRGHDAREEHHPGDTGSALGASDLAGKYASRLRGYQVKCLDEPEYGSVILSYSGADVLLSRQAQLADYTAVQGVPTNSTPVSQAGGGSRVTRSDREEAVTPMHFPRNVSDTAQSSPMIARPPSTQAQVSGVDYAGANFRPANYDDPSNQNNFALMGDMLGFGQDFADLDRVITSNGADFSFYPMNEFGYGYNPI